MRIKLDMDIRLDRLPICRRATIGLFDHIIETLLHIVVIEHRAFGTLLRRLTEWGRLGHLGNTTGGMWGMSGPNDIYASVRTEVMTSPRPPTEPPWLEEVLFRSGGTIVPT